MRRIKNFTFLALLLSSLVIVAVSSSKVNSEEVYVFYGYAPPVVQNLTQPVFGPAVFNYSVRQARLDIVGLSDGTSVEVFDLTSKTSIAAGSVNRMGLWTVYLGKAVASVSVPPVEGTYFKVVSNKLVAVCVSSGGVWERDYTQYGVAYGEFLVGGFSTFYTSVDGGFVGKEFIFMTTPTWAMFRPQVIETNTYTVFGIEGSRVEVYDSQSSRVATLEVKANTFGKIPLQPWKVYRVTSTGNILIGGLSTESLVQLPSATGGFIGKTFYGLLTGYHHTVAGRTDTQGLAIVANEDCELKVYDLTKEDWQITLMGPESKANPKKDQLFWNANLSSSVPLRIDSSSDVSVLLAKGGLQWGAPIGYPPINFIGRPDNIGDDITIAGARAGQTLGFYATTQAVIFAPDSLTITVDNVPLTMEKDTFMILPTGVHKITSNKPVIVEILSSTSSFTIGITDWPTYDSIYESYGTYLVSLQGLERTYPTPAGVGGFGLLIFIGAGVAVAVIVVAIFFVMRRRKSA